MSTREESFRRLRAELWKSSGDFRTGLTAAGAKVQSLSDGSGDCVCDEYAFLVTKMPEGETPESFLLNMATDLNGTVADGGFNAINKFKRSRKGAPEVGEIIYIDILGPDNGCVILAELEKDYFIFQTVETPEAGTHPENGSREFGFDMFGRFVRIYTRGVSRPGNALIRLAGKGPQTIGWTRLCRGLSDTLERRGGSPLKLSFTQFKQNRKF